jgi:hypothetical protein
VAVRARLASMVMAAVLVAACGGTPASRPAGPGSTPAPSATGAGSTVPGSSSPCSVAVTYLGALAERLAGDLAALRPLVVAARFDGAETATANRQVSATLTAYAGIEQTLAGCEATAGLAERVAQLRSGAGAILEGSLSAGIRDAQVHWDAAVELLGLMPEVLALSQEANGIAAGLGIDVAVATDPGGAVDPGRSPPPGTAWAEFPAWADGFWPLMSERVGKIKDAVKRGKAASIVGEAKKLVGVAATGQQWLAGHAPWACYQSYWKLTDDAVDAYLKAANAYTKPKSTTGKKLLKQADGLLAQLKAVPRDRFTVRCQIDPAAPG